ncbi:MAG: tetratricopeptide repeat protein [Spirochaetes bacterium]|nr:tetratricopeptide repeat protein [Spirochaetota bacterium]
MAGLNDRKKFSAVRRIVLCAVLPLLLLAGGAEGRNAISFNNEGWEYLKRGDSFKAVFSFKNALNMNPRYREALVGLARAYYEVQAYEQSFDLYTRALKLDPASGDALTGMGFTLIALGDYTGSMKHFERAVKASGENLEAQYGIAYLYSAMGKRLWAKRKLQSIFRVNPYHVDSLLLMAQIKGDENRLGEARKLVDKAIDADRESPRGYARYGEILLRDYIASDREDSLSDAMEAFRNSLSIQPKQYDANRFMGIISLIRGDYPAAIGYFRDALSDPPNSAVYYCLGVAHDRAGDKEEALNSFMKAMKLTSQDPIMKSRVEDFLVLGDYKIGHPMRVMLDHDNFDTAAAKARKNLHDQVVMYLRRALLMNPLDREAREQLMEYYQINDYHDLYIEELKELQRNFKEGDFRNRLTVAILKRRERLYHREGFSFDPAERNVPAVLVLNLDPQGTAMIHPDAGDVISSYLTFVLQQFGRMETVGVRSRMKADCGMKCAGEHLFRSVERVQELVKSEELKRVDYIVYGTYREQGNWLSVDMKLLDNSRGFVIGEFSVSEKGKESLPVLSLRAARQIYSLMPFTGRALKIKEQGIVVNLGLIDGIEPGERLVVYKMSDGILTKKRKIVFIVREADTFLSYAETGKEEDLELIDTNDTVYPLKKRRARRIR